MSRRKSPQRRQPDRTVGQAINEMRPPEGWDLSEDRLQEAMALQTTFRRHAHRAGMAVPHQLAAALSLVCGLIDEMGLPHPEAIELFTGALQHLDTRVTDGCLTQSSAAEGVTPEEAEVIQTEIQRFAHVLKERFPRITGVRVFIDEAPAEKAPAGTVH